MKQAQRQVNMRKPASLLGGRGGFFVGLSIAHHSHLPSDPPAQPAMTCYDLRLDRYNYEVRVEAGGYLIQRRDDPTDVLSAPTFELLLDFADLMEWAAQREHPQ